MAFLTLGINSKIELKSAGRPAETVSRGRSWVGANVVFPLSQQSCGACACCGLGSKSAMARTHTTANHQPQHFANRLRTLRKVSAVRNQPRLFHVPISAASTCVCVCAESDPAHIEKPIIYSVRRFCLQAAFAVCGATTSSLFSCVAAFIAHSSGLSAESELHTRENRAAATTRLGGVSLLPLAREKH